MSMDPVKWDGSRQSPTSRDDQRHFEIVPKPEANLTPQQYINVCNGISCIQ